MKLRSSNIGTPLVVEKLTVHRYCAIENLSEVPVLNDDFKLIPYAGNLSRTFRSRIKVIKISCTVFVDGSVWMAFCRVGSIVEHLHFKTSHPAVRVLLGVLVNEVDDS